MNKLTSLQKKQLTIFVIIGLGIIGVLINKIANPPQNNTIVPQETTNNVKIHCWRCGIDLTNTYNRIETDDNKYECTPCYEQTMKEIHDEMRAKGYVNDHHYESK